MSVFDAFIVFCFFCLIFYFVDPLGQFNEMNEDEVEDIISINVGVQTKFVVLFNVVVICLNICTYIFFPALKNLGLVLSKSSRRQKKKGLGFNKHIAQIYHT